MEGLIIHYPNYPDRQTIAGNSIGYGFFTGKIGNRSGLFLRYRNGIVQIADPITGSWLSMQDVTICGYRPVNVEIKVENKT